MATRALNIPQLGAARIDRTEAATMIGLALSSALMAIGALVFALLTWVVVFVPHVTDSLAVAGFRFAFHDDNLRRDALETLGFELSFAWLLTFLAILWWRGGVFRALSNPQAGGHHGN